MTPSLSKTMLRTIFTGLMLFLFGSIEFLSAQNNDVIPVMMVHNLRPGIESPMRLEQLHIDIKIVGQIATTTLDMTYMNPNYRIMEGEFSFPLSEGQTISRFALDINGKLREGVVVEKEKGRAAFEAIVRKGVDPGLLEMTQGNNFRMRVYPLPPRGTRRVVIAIEQELSDKGEYDLYTLPLQVKEVISKFSIDAQVLKNSVKVDTEKNGLVNLSFKKWNDSYVAHLEQNDFVADKLISLAFPHVSGDNRVFVTNIDANKDASYFYTQIRPEITTQEKVLPKRITLFWDHSNSAKHRNLNKELSVLGNYIRKIGNLSIELVPFHYKVDPSERFDIVDGNWNALKSRLEAFVYDGATAIGALDFTKYSCDEMLLFSDGMTTFGTDQLKFSATPLMTINSSFVSHSMFLTYLAQKSGSVYIDLNKLNEEEALAKMISNDYHFISAQVKEGEVKEMFPSMPCSFNKTFSISGKLLGKSAKVLLNFGFGTKITYSKLVDIEADSTTTLPILGRLWAEKQITELSINENDNKDKIYQLGKQFGIVTRNTSFIVLENVEDYLLYDILPPMELREAYLKIRAEKNKTSEKDRLSHLEEVVSMSKRQSRWWNTIYPIAPVKTVTSTMRFIPPVIKRDEQVNEETTQIVEQIVESKAAISIADVKGETDAPSNENNSVTSKTIGIELNAWDPQTPYLKVLQYAAKGSEYTTYLKLKKEYGATPSFYVDVADFFQKQNKRDTALTILSNVAELSLQSPQLLRILGNKLMDYKRYDEAVLVFRKVLSLRGEEPQSYRDLGLAYEAKGDYQLAINTLYQVVVREFNRDFPDIELIAMNEINAILSKHPTLKYHFIDSRLIKREPVDIRVCLTWDTDNCDMDLWVTDPKGEKCFFQHQLTRIGGKISEDFTNGYGPEEFMIKNAIAGKYHVQANYYGTNSQTVLAPVSLHLAFFTNYGKPNQTKKEVTIRLDTIQSVIDIGRFNFLK